MIRYKVRISEQAKFDIQEVKAYYLNIDKKLSKSCVLEITKTIDKLAENPIHHQIRYKNIRIAFTSTFPYGVHFMVDKETVYILRVFHTKRFFK